MTDKTMQRVATMDKVVALAKRRGFVFPGSDIYGGLANTWDYGPLGVELKNTIKQLWWRTFVQRRRDMVGLDAGILMHPRVWEASGHVANFNDPLVDCKTCKARFRADHLVEERLGRDDAEALTPDELSALIRDANLPCPNCGNRTLTDARQFNMMFNTTIGPVDESATKVYLRPETAQGIFVQYKNLVSTQRVKVPFGIAQIGKAFRNEVTPRNFTFRSREFEQMEIEFFCEPSSTPEWYRHWRDLRLAWWKSVGLQGDNLVLREHERDELAHYAKTGAGTSDIEYRFPFSHPGFGELEGVADRGNYDLSQHMHHARTKLEYFEPETNQRYVPHVIEPSAGVDRGVLALLCEAYTEDPSRPSKMFMRFTPRMAPVKAAVFPLVAKDGMPEVAEKLFAELKSRFGCVEMDVKQTIGKRYARMDEAGCPYCFTVDGDTASDQAVTVRDRDNLTQERIALDRVAEWLAPRLTAGQE